MRKTFLIMILFLPGVAHAVCDTGYHLTDDKCVPCPSPYYCPDENTVTECPTDSTDWYAVFTSQGYDIVSVSEPHYISWAQNGQGPHKITHCYIDIWAVTSDGKFLIEPYFANVAYYQQSRKMWYSASPGYYLSPYAWTSTNDWYNGVKACTNAPEHAHYTGAGTPDAPDGSIIDANDCPWACDDGYDNHDGECVAHVATCDPGYYLKNGECVTCNPQSQAYYCPGDDMRYACPTTDTDYNDNPFGYILDDGREAGYASKTAIHPKGCISLLNFHDEHGNKLRLESQFNGENYWGNNISWFQAGPGYYLSSYDLTSYGRDWYFGVKACTNAPEHAHYTGAGTPDAPDGSIIDANDCPWACDDGYGNHDGKCVPLCSAGVRYIRADNGLRINLYQTPYSSPRIAVEYNNAVCYGVLAPGAQSGTINVDVAGTTYHVEN